MKELEAKVQPLMKNSNEAPRIVPGIFERILGIMRELDYIQKGPKSVNGQYRYASHDQVSAAIHPLLVKYGVVIIPSVEELRQEGNRTVVKLNVVFVNAECPTDSFHSTHYGYGVDQSDKGPGKAISYAYKYALLKTFCLETGDDPDQDVNAVYEPEKCTEFDFEMSHLNEREKAKLNKFLIYSSQIMKKHVEDVKREALNKIPDFLAAFAKWNPKKKEETDV